MSLDYIRKTYGVPAKRLGLIKFLDRKENNVGQITGAKNGYLRVRFEGEKHAVYLHPTWLVVYIDPYKRPKQ